MQLSCGVPNLHEALGSISSPALRQHCGIPTHRRQRQEDQNVPGYPQVQNDF